MMIPFLIVSAIVPSLLLIWFFHARDVYPEPQRVVWATFGLGVLTIPPAIGVELLIQSGLKHVANPFLGGTLEGFVCAGMTEEVLKYLVVVFYCMRHKEFDEPMDGIVYGSIASLGFATLENFFYVVQGGESIAIFRAFTAVPGHAFMGAIMGYFVGQAKFTPARRRGLLAKALVIPILLHGAYDAPLLTVQRLTADKHHTRAQMMAGVAFALVTLAVLVFETTWTLILTSRLRREQLQWSARRWAAYHARQPQPPAPWDVPAPTYGAPPAAGPAGSTGGLPARGRGTALGWLLVFFGGLLACGGGLMALGSLLVILDPSKASGSPAVFVAVGVLMGLMPLGVGLLLFGPGVRRLARSSPLPAPAFVAPASW
jgi:RsiW-degrading membrane proteinase PrsW (M82 family)